MSMSVVSFPMCLKNNNWSNWHKWLCKKKANNQKNSKPKWSIYSIVLFFPLKGGCWVDDGLAFLVPSKSLLKTLWRAHWELVGEDLQPQGFTVNPMCNVIDHLPPSSKSGKRKKNLTSWVHPPSPHWPCNTCVFVTEFITHFCSQLIVCLFS